MNDFNISVVIPMYNREDKICRALDSIYSQTNIECLLEVIVVDDGSTDKSVDVVNDYSKTHSVPPIRLFKQKNSGPSAARNKGMELASGNLIAFLDSDDMWLPDKTMRQIEIFEKYPDAGLVGCNHEKRPLKIGFKKIQSFHKATLRELCIKSYPVTPSVIIKKEIYDKIGGFDETIRCYEDCDYFQTICALKYGYYYLPDQLVELDDKRQFGEKGLSSNLKESHRDSIVSLKKLYKNHYIGFFFYLFLRCFYLFKHWRRSFISLLSKKK